jgi:hypothetical protein
MTKLMLITGAVYTEMSPEEVRTYLQGGVKAGTIPAYLDEQKTQPITLAVHAIEYIYLH